MSFLKTVGQDVAKAFNFLRQHQPAITAIAKEVELVAPPAAPYIESGLALEGIIVGIESKFEVLGKGTGSGAEKLAQASPLVLETLKQAQFMSDKQIVDAAKYTAAATAIASAFADLLNATEAKVQG